MTKHTPGPWRVGTLESEDMPYEVFSLKEGGRRIAVMTATRENDDTRANAALIAAGPDMLQALRKSLEWVGRAPRKEEMEQYSVCRGAILAAIKKAEGGAV